MDKIRTVAAAMIGITVLPAAGLVAPETTQNDVLMLAPMALDNLRYPPSRITNAIVMDRTGSPIGTVRKVELDAVGKPLRADIALLGSNQVIAVDPSILSYDGENNTLTSSLDKTQIVRMPAATRG